MAEQKFAQKKMKDMLNSLSKLQFKFESILNWNKFKAVMINYKKIIILQLQPYWNEVGTIYITHFWKSTTQRLYEPS